MTSFLFLCETVVKITFDWTFRIVMFVLENNGMLVLEGLKGRWITRWIHFYFLLCCCHHIIVIDTTWPHFATIMVLKAVSMFCYLIAFCHLKALWHQPETWIERVGQVVTQHCVWFLWNTFCLWSFSCERELKFVNMTKKTKKKQFTVLITQITKGTMQKMVIMGLVLHLPVL